MMKKLTVSLNLPGELLRVLNVLESGLELRLRERYCVPYHQGSTDPLARLKRSQLIGSFHGDPDLSENSELIFQDLLTKNQ